MESWERSLDDVITLEVPHVSVYMLEVDDDSRLGRELIAGGTRYHAHHVPDEELTVHFYERACLRLAMRRSRNMRSPTSPAKVMSQGTTFATGSVFPTLDLEWTLTRCF